MFILLAREITVEAKEKNMSITSVSSGSSYATQDDFQERKKAFDTLGKDLSSGDLKSAQADFAKLQKDAPSGLSSSSKTSSGTTGSNDFNTLAADLKSGDISGAQQAYSNIQKTIAQNSKGGPNGTQQGPSDEVKKDFETLSSALKSGDLSSAKSAFADIQKHMPQAPDPGDSTPSTSSSSTTSTATENPVEKEFAALSTALNSGDLSSAQSAFATIQSQMQQGSAQSFSLVGANLNVSA
jgi:outer membrane protein assembly factor BamD (BamD/ComL family)